MLSIKKVLGAAVLIVALVGVAYVLSKSPTSPIQKEFKKYKSKNPELANEVLKATGNLTKAVEFLNYVNSTNISASTALAFVKDYPDIVKNNNYKYPLAFYSENSTTFDGVYDNIQSDPNLSKNLSNSISLASEVFLLLDATNDPYVCNLAKLIISDGEISPTDLKALSYFKQARNIVPNETRIYYSQRELDQIGYNLVKSLLADGNITQDEAQAVKYLNSTKWEKRWWIKKDIINSGMINHKYLSEDWDKDGLSNMKEIKQGTNPLNDLETNPNNLSERYAILVETYAEDNRPAHNCIGIYHALKKFGGYDDDHIVVFFTLNESIKDVATWRPPFYSWLKGDPLKDYPVKLDYVNENVTIENYKKALISLSHLSDGNDEVFIWYSGHGGPYFVFNYPEYGLLHIKAQMPYLITMKYGRLIFIHTGCSAEDLFKYMENSTYIYHIPQFLGIADASTGEGDTPAFIENFFLALERGLSIKQAFDYSKSIVAQVGRHPVIYYFNNGERTECRWIDDVNPLIYIPNSSVRKSL